MAVVRTDFVNGFVDDNPLAVGGTTLNSTGLADLEAVTGSDIAKIILDPKSRYGDPEIVHVTAHTASADNATILRGQEGTSAREHQQGTQWVHGPVESDWDHGVLTGLGDDDHTIYVLADGTRGITGEQAFSRGVSTNNAVSIKVTGDSNSRFIVDAAGKMTWGSGSATGDTTLYRSTANTLKTDDNISVAGGTVYIGSDCSVYRSGANALQTDDALRVNSTFRADDKASIAVATSSTTALGLRASADAVDRFYSDASGKMYWGDGTNPVDANFYRSGAATLKTDNTLVVNRLDVSSNTYAHVPVGSLMPYAASSAPSGWFLCYGQAVSRTTYSELFALIGTTYGVGDGATTYNLPDLRGRVVAAVDNLGGSDAGRLSWSNTLGTSGGAQTHLLTYSESGLRDHGHGGSFVTGFTQAAGIAFGSFYNVSFGGVGNSGSLNAESSHNNMQPTILMAYIIKY